MPAPAPGAPQSAGPIDAGGAVTLRLGPASRFRKASEGGFLEEAVAGPGFGDWSLQPGWGAGLRSVTQRSPTGRHGEGRDLLLRA